MRMKIIKINLVYLKKIRVMILAKNKEEWWGLVRADLAKWNNNNDPDDRMSIQDWIGETGPNIYGWIAFRDDYGDWDVSLDGHPEYDEDEDY
jgi:hypothetical protein